MLLHILKKDLKRKKTMNVVLGLFVILASMFVASSLSNMLSVLNGTDYFLDKAGLGDYIVILFSGDPDQDAEKFFSENPYVKDFRMERGLGVGRESISSPDREIKPGALCDIISVKDDGLKYFDENDNVITDVEPGHVRVTASFLSSEKLKKGDRIHFSIGDVEKDFIIDGPLKDAALGSPIMGNVRFMINDDEMNSLYENESIHSKYKGYIIYVDTDDVSSFTKTLADLSGISFDGSRTVIKTSYVMTMIIVFVILIVSIALIIVAFVMLKFAINVSVMEDFREIGVMKAIGIRNRRIRGLYAAKYFLLAIVGTLIGLILSFPFGNLLMKSVSDNMVLGNDSEILIHIVGALLVVITISGFAWLCTRKVKKLSPIDAIRSGQTGERFRKKKVKGKARGRKHTEFFLAVNDIRSTPKRYLSVFLSLFICTLLVLTLVNTTSTMRSDSFVHTFGARGDIYVSDDEAMRNLQVEDKDALTQYMAEKEKLLADHGMPCVIKAETQYKYKVIIDGSVENLTFQQGVNTHMSDYEFLTGSAPQNGNEIAVTKAVSESTGLKVGDTFTLDFGDRTEEFLVSATYQTMNNMGQMTLMHEDAATDFIHLSQILELRICFTDSPDEKEIEKRKDKISEIWDIDEEQVMTAEEYCVKTMGAADTMEALQNLLLVITMIVVILVTLLMERSFVADEKTQIALLKAVGFRNGKIVRWHVFRFTICSFFAIVLAVALSIPVTHLAITPIFAMMGAGKVDFRYAWSLTALYPAIIFGFTILMTWVVAQCTKKIKSSDTANIE